MGVLLCICSCFSVVFDSTKVFVCRDLIDFALRFYAHFKFYLIPKLHLPFYHAVRSKHLLKRTKSQLSNLAKVAVPPRGTPLMFAWASPQDLMFLQTTVMSKVDMCTKRCTSRSRMLVAAVRGREGGGFITSQHSCQTDNLSLCNTTGCRITRDVFQPFLW